MQGRLIDKVRVYARGGGGGQGSPKSGGFGGDGGDVIVQAHKCSFADLARRDSRRFIAGRGQHYKCVYITSVCGVCGARVRVCVLHAVTMSTISVAGSPHYLPFYKDTHASITDGLPNTGCGHLQNLLHM